MSWLAHPPRCVITCASDPFPCCLWAIGAEVSALPHPPGWIHIHHPPSASHHQQWQNNWKTLCLWLSNIDLCVFPWSCGTASVLLLPWPSSVRSAHSLRKASLPRWWTDIIKSLYLTILITGFIWWLDFCHKNNSEDFSWCITFPPRGGMQLKSIF